MDHAGRRALNAGEPDEDGLRRELLEEMGLRDFDLGPLIFERTHQIPWGRRIVRQHDRFYLVRVDRHEVAPTVELEDEFVTAHHWWTLAELEETRERIAPPNLAELVRLHRCEVSDTGAGGSAPRD